MKILIQKQKLQAIIAPLYPTDDVNFQNGVFTSVLKRGEAVVSVKTGYNFLRGQIHAELLKAVSRKIPYGSFYIGIEEKPLRLVFQKKNYSLKLNLSDYDPPEIVSLYHIYPDSWQECPSDLFFGISELFRICKPEDSSDIFKHYGLLHGKEFHLCVGKGNLICRYRLSVPLPYEIMIDPFNLQTILSKVKNLKVMRMARVTYAEVTGIVFDFGEMRIFIPEIFEEEFRQYWLKDSIYESKPKTKEDFEILDDLKKVRDLPQPPVCKNLIPEINSYFKHPCSILFIPPKSIRTILAPFLMAERLTIEISAVTLTLSAEDEKIKINKQRHQIKFLTAGTGNISITVRTEDFYKSVISDSLIGTLLLESDNGSRSALYVKNKNMEYLITSI